MAYCTVERIDKSTIMMTNTDCFINLLVIRAFLSVGGHTLVPISHFIVESSITNISFAFVMDVWTDGWMDKRV